jgi:hypothetical protein
MTQRRRDTKAILRALARSELRSPLFRWMVEHHDEMVEASQRDGIHWASFCDEAAKRGLTDTRGLAPNPANARKTWAQARKVVQEGREAAKPPRPKPPSRFPKDWSPTVLREQEIPVPAYLRPAGAEVPPYLRPPSTVASVPAPFHPPPLPAKPAGPAGNEVTAQRPKRGSMDAALDKLGENDWWLGDGRPKPRSDER